MSLAESLLMRAINRQVTPRAPVWLMRQAGRYLPEYLKTRAAAGSFLKLCQTKELACEVTLQPLRRFQLDAAILFSDILTIPDAMGLGLSFVENEGPKFQRPIREIASIDALELTQMEEKLGYVFDAVSLIRQELPTDLPLIGFSGSPWTLAAYMIEGESSRDFKKALKMMYLEPQAMHRLLDKLATAIIQYLAGQIAAGVSVVMLFDTWGGLLTTHHYHAFSLTYMQKIVSVLRALYPDIPIILFTKGGSQWLPSIAETGCQAIGVDWTCDLQAARRAVGHLVALQGNLDPTVLLSSASCIEKEVKRVLSAYGEGSGLIFNLGHGITPDVPVEHVQAMIDAVHEWSSVSLKDETV